MKFRICRKTKSGFETQEFSTLEDAKKEKSENGGNIDIYNDQLRCWVTLRDSRKRRV